MGTASPFGCSLASPHCLGLCNLHTLSFSSPDLVLVHSSSSSLSNGSTPIPVPCIPCMRVHHQLLTEWPKDHGLDQGTPCDGTVQPSGRPAGGRTGRAWPTSTPCPPPPSMFSSTNFPLPLTGHLASEGTCCEVVISFTIFGKPCGA